jgi:hypothetical protein
MPAETSKYLVSTRSTHVCSAPPWFIRVRFVLPALFYAASFSVVSAGAWRAASSCVAFGRAWRNGSYTSPPTHRRCSNTASFRATATRLASWHSSRLARSVVARIS